MSRFGAGSCTADRHQLHVYVDDATRDHRGHGRCGTCGLPKSNRLHRVPPRSDEERAHDARKVGD